MSKTNVYLAMWDCYGLEALYNLTKWSEQATYNTLVEKPAPQAPPINQLMLRARYNPQRHYEIYNFSVEEDVTEEKIREVFEKNPQFIVDYIRKHGMMLWSDKLTYKQKRVIE